MKLPRHQDVDSKILEIDRPLGLFWHVTIAMMAMILLISWAGLVGLYAFGWISFNGWHYISVPALFCVSFVLLPTLFMFGRVAFGILNMLIMTVEAWAARAGFSLDINRDGYIGYYEAKPPQIEVRRPIPLNTSTGTKLLAQEAAALPAAAEQLAAEPEAQEADETPIERKLIMLPNGSRVPAETIENVLLQLIEQGRGLGRKAWVPKILDREVYDGLWSLFSSCGIIEGRKNKYAGRLAVESMAEARRILGAILK